MRSPSRPPRRSLAVWLPLAASLTLAVGIVVGLGLQPGAGPLIAVGQAAEVEGNAHGVGPVEEILRYIEAKYVDDVDRGRLLEGAVGNLLAELDPHSAYVAPAQLAGHRDALDGEATGIGVDVIMVRDSVTVVSALPGGPAAEAGLRPYDRIVAIGDTVVSGRGRDVAAVEAIMRSAPPGPVRLRVYRPGSGRLMPIALNRARVPVPSVAPGLLLDDDVAYVRVRQFAANTYEEFMRELERLTQDSSARHLVIDLRGNSGGYLQEAVRLLGQLFPQEGRLLVYTQGAHSPRKEYTATGRVLFPVDGVAVIVDGGSASASEIVAGAVQDWDRGIVVGQRSFGKGLVQELYPLKGGGALHITVSRYFTPSGRSIQRDYEDLGAYRAGELDSAGGGSRPEAFVTAGGRTVYGGGGIAPDVEVFEDRRLRRPEFAQALGDVEAFAFEEVEDVDAFDADRAGEGLRDYLADRGHDLSDADWDYYREPLARELELAVLARRSGEGAAATARVLEDPYVRAAVESLREPRAIARGQ